MSPSTVGVVVPAYNAREFVGGALESVLAQTHPVDEIVVVDDGSTDGTADFLQERYRERCGERLRVLRLAHGGAACARNAALKACRSEWIAFLDADDGWQPEKNARQLAYLAQHPEVVWLSSDGVFCESAGVLRDSWLSDYFQPVRELRGDLYRLLVDRCFVLTSSVLARRDLVLEVGGMREDLANAQDYDLWLKLAARGPGALLAERLTFYRRRPGSLSTSQLSRLSNNIRLREGVAKGEPRPDPVAQRTAAFALTEFYWSLGLELLREGRAAEARGAFRAAALRPGLWRLRLLSLGAALLPGDWALGLRGRSWARGVVTSNKPVVGPIAGELMGDLDGRGGAAR